MIITRTLFVLSLYDNFPVTLARGWSPFSTRSSRRDKVSSQLKEETGNWTSEYVNAERNSLPLHSNPPSFSPPSSPSPSFSLSLSRPLHPPQKQLLWRDDKDHPHTSLLFVSLNQTLSVFIFRGYSIISFSVAPDTRSKTLDSAESQIWFACMIHLIGTITREQLDIPDHFRSKWRTVR